MGAQIGEKVPFWDSRDEFGDTCLLVLKPEEGRSLAKALGPNWLVLMRRHGATVAGQNLTELVFRTIYSYRNAELQLMHPVARPSAQPAHARRGQARLGAQPRAAAAGARLGILVGPAQEGRRISQRRPKERAEGRQCAPQQQDSRSPKETAVGASPRTGCANRTNSIKMIEAA